MEREKVLQNLQKDVMDSISICHPIMHGNYNLCDYASNKNLDKLSIPLLQDICSSLQLDISNICPFLSFPLVMCRISFTLFRYKRSSRRNSEMKTSINLFKNCSFRINFTLVSCGNWCHSGFGPPFADLDPPR